MPPFTEIVAFICLGWYVFIAGVCTIGYLCLLKYYRTAPPRSLSSSSTDTDAPHVTVIRPCKGIEPYLYECLAATFQQDYPVDKLTVFFCLSSKDDPAYPTLERVIKDHPGFDAHVLVEEEDSFLIGDGETHGSNLGPNPKIRNMSRAYREAKGDVVWIIDCNVWVGRGTCGRMVDKLYGYSTRGQVRPYKFVHLLPVAVDVKMPGSKGEQQLVGQYDETSSVPILSDLVESDATASHHGGRLDELFLASSHAKMYMAINVVAVAPCIVGKSNMFRRSHLNYLTRSRTSQKLATTTTSNPQAGQGIDYFSYNICEDHLIGDLLWKSHIPASLDPNNTRPLRNHGLVYGDLAIQPISSMSVSSYIARRVRWLRVRKFTVPVATLVEPGTESFLCSVYGAFGATTSRYTTPYFGTSWWTFAALWLVSIGIWAAVDWTVYMILHSGRTVEVSPSTVDAPAEKEIPVFARPIHGKLARRPFLDWFAAWLGREALTLPIWLWAIWGGTSVTWRDRRFRVGLDMKVHEILDVKPTIVAGERSGLISVTNGKMRHD